MAGQLAQVSRHAPLAAVDSLAVVKALPMDTEASRPVRHRTHRAKGKALVSRATPMRPPGRSAATMTRPSRAHTCRLASRRRACRPAGAAIGAVVVVAAAAVAAVAIAAADRAAAVALVAAATDLVPSP